MANTGPRQLQEFGQTIEEEVCTHDAEGITWCAVNKADVFYTHSKSDNFFVITIGSPDKGSGTGA